FPELLSNAPEPLDTAVDLNDGNGSIAQFVRDGCRQLLDETLGRAAARLHPAAQRFVVLRLEIAERELFELVLHLAHPETVGDWRVNVARFLRDWDPPIVGEMVERPHVVEPVGELDQN